MADDDDDDVPQSGQSQSEDESDHVPELPDIRATTTQSTIKTFDYIPDGYQKAIFTKCEEDEVNEITSSIAEIFNKRILAGRLDVDNALKSFKRETKNPMNAALTACFESWKQMAFTDYDNQDKKEAWIVQFNDVQEIKSIRINEKKEYLSPEVSDIGDSMEELLVKCHNLFENYEFTQQQMMMDKNQMEQKVAVKTMKIETVFSEVEKLEKEMERIVNEVKNLLVNMKTAIESRMVVKQPKLATGLIYNIREN